MAYIGILLMLAGIIGIFMASKKPLPLVIWLILIAMVLQILSFMIFSGIMQKSVGLSWMVIGLIIGGIFGIYARIELRESRIFYRQNLIFALSYMALLLVNQLIALFFKTYIPAMLFITALAVGMQIGFNLVMILKGKKLKKIKTASLFISIVILLHIFSGVSLTAAAQDPCVESAVSHYKGWIESYRNWLANGGNYALETPEPELRARIEAEANAVASEYYSGKITYEESTSRTDAIWREYYLRAWQLTLNREYRSMMEKIKRCEKEHDISVGKIPSPDLNNMNSLNFKAEIIANEPTQAKPEHNVQTEPEHQAQTELEHQTQTEPERQEPAQESAITEQNKPEYPEQNQPLEQHDFAEKGPNQKQSQTDNDNPFLPQPVSGEDANTATAVSGLLAGLSALISLISSFNGGATNLPGLSLLNTPYPADIPGQPSSNEPSAPHPPSPPPEPAIGTRREDGKIYTKNHGWQNEYWPETQANSLKQTILSLENDIQKHMKNGDKLKAEIAMDELKYNTRELKRWSEDINAVKRGQTFDSADMLQNSAKRWDAYAEQAGTAAKVAGGISFASDIALTVGTSGALPALTSFKKTLESLSLAKEIVGAAADGYVDGKSLSVAITEFGINKGISVGVGKAFDIGKAKYDMENAKNALKAIVSAGENSTASVVQQASKEFGVTKAITDVAEAHDNYLQKRMEDILRERGMR